MKKIVILLLLLSNLFVTKAQNGKNVHFCGTDELLKEKLANDNQFKINFESSKIKWQKFAVKNANYKSNRVWQGVVTLPIAIHDLSGSNTFLLPSGSNINDYQYIIDALNNVYSVQQTEIQFCLVKKDINGDLYDFADTQDENVVNATNLDRTDATQISSIVSSSSNGYPQEFHPNNFINIYIVDQIDGPTAGFAYLPSSHGNFKDGIYMERQWLDNINLANDIKILVHEMGHYLGLFHTFQSTFLHDDGAGTTSCDENYNCLNDGDMICDTPPHLNPTDVTDFPNDCSNRNTCFDIPVPTITDGTHFLVETDDPVFNFMNYSPQSCQNEFTDGQILRMHFMVDPDDGPRKSLLDIPNLCVECVDLDECEFSIETSIPLEAPRNYINEGTNVNFTTINDCSNTDITYTYTLTELAGNTQLFVDSATASSNGLAVGNYLLEVTATDNNNFDCFEIIEYYFTVIPTMSTPCLSLPDVGSTDWGEWNRISYNANIAGNHNWVNPDTQTPISDNTAGFEIIPLSAGDQISGDNNFTGVTLPTEATIDRVMRVGRKYISTDDGGVPSGGGRAHFVQRTIQVTPDNCRFRVWYLGGTHGEKNKISTLFYKPSQANNDASFGWLCEYKYNSEVVTVGSNISTIGSSYNSGENSGTNYNRFNQNDYISLRLPFSQPYFNGGNFNKMTAWQSRILDFSEFASLDNPITEITLTFFEHSNDNLNAVQNAYAYYGIECLGGGLPQSFELNIPDISVPCTASSVNQVTIDLNTDPTLDIYNYGWLNFRDDNYEFRNIELFIQNVDGTWTPYGFNDYQTGMSFNIDANDPDANSINYEEPFRVFRIVYTSLNDSVEDAFKVFLGFNNNDILCTSTSFDYDSNSNGIIEFEDFDLNGDNIIDNTDYDLDADGIIDDFIYDTNSDGIIDITDFDTDGNGLIDNNDVPIPYPSDARTGSSNFDTNLDGIIDFTDDPLPNLNDYSMSSNGNFLVCTVDDIPQELILSPSCVESFNALDRYQWIGSYIYGSISIETESLSVKDFFDLLITQNRETTNLNRDYYYFRRKAYYTEPYCGTPQYMQSEMFKIYNLNHFEYANGTITKQDECFDENVDTSPPITISIDGAKIFRFGGNIPDEFCLDFSNNNLHFQLHDPRATDSDPDGNGQDFGNIVDFSFSGQVGNSYNPGNGEIDTLTFTFNNINPENPSLPLFVPESGEITYFPLQIHVTGEYGHRCAGDAGCSKNLKCVNCEAEDGCENCGIDLYFNLTEIGFRSAAVDGEIVYNCNDRLVESIDDGYTVEGYRWEYRPDPSIDSYIVIPGSPTTNILQPLPDFNTLPTPLIIRRVSQIPDNANNYDCISEDPTDEITIYPPPATPTINVIPPTCSVASVVEFSNLPDGDWTINAISSGTSTPYNGIGNTYSIFDLDAGDYTFTVTNDTPCDSDATLEVTIEPQPLNPEVPEVSTSCTASLGTIEITNPLGIEYEYSIDGVNYQTSPLFTDLSNADYSVFVRLVDYNECFSELLVNINCSCDTPPTIQLNGSSENVCGLDPITVTNNSFGGSATNVTITENGFGTVSPVLTTTNNFDFTYTPTVDDIGNTVTITLITNNPLGVPCEAASVEYVISINETPTSLLIDSVSPSSCDDSLKSVTLSNLPSGTWQIEVQPTGETYTGSGSTFEITNLLQNTDYTFTVTNSSNCTSVPSSVVRIDQLTLPVTPSVTTYTENCRTYVTLSDLPIVDVDERTIIATNQSGVSFNYEYLSTSTNYTIDDLPQGTYTFVIVNNSSANCISDPTDPVDVFVIDLIQPEFDLPTNICGDVPLPILNTTSSNGVEGIWNPTIVTTLVTEYTFTPNTDQCAEIYIHNFIFQDECAPLTLTWGGDVSCQVANFNEKPDYDIADGECIRICEGSIVDYEITGFTDNIVSSSWYAIGGTISNQTNTSCTITWEDLDTAYLFITLELDSGEAIYLNRCIEKVSAPIALFGIMPDLMAEETIVCIDNPISFENLTTVNGGHDDLYYNWDFGDGTTSNEFEPVHSYQEVGVYEVTLTAYNGCNCLGTFSKKVIVEKTELEISCPSIVCEGEQSIYSVSRDYEDCNLKWDVIGGDIVWSDNNDTSVGIVWNNVEDGFGYVTVTGEECFECGTTVKIPVIQNNAKIIGSSTICQNEQAIFTLPQWATTEFNWTIDANGTGAVLLAGGTQRNEIIIQANKPGTVKLMCNYYNTLLGCGGYTEMKIEVKPAVEIADFDVICTGVENTFEFQTLNGNPITNLSWNIYGENFELSGTGSPSVSFENAGNYIITASSDEYCLPNAATIQVFEAPEDPIINEANDPICLLIPTNFTCNPPEHTTAIWEVDGGTILGSEIGNTITVNFDINYTSDYTLRLKYISEGGCEAETEVNLLLDEPNLGFLPDLETLVCGSSRTSYGVFPVEADSYTWSIQPQNVGSVESGQNTNEIEILWNQPATSITGITVTVAVRKCGKTFEKEFSGIEILAAPSIENLQYDDTICANDVFNASFDLAGGFTINQVVWDFGDGTPIEINTNTNATHIYQDPLTESTTYTVTATVIANECPNPTTISFDVTVAPSPEIFVGIETVNFYYITEDYYDIYVTQQGGFSATDTITWYQVSSAGDFAVFTGNPFRVTPDDTGHYFYAVVTNAYGCTDSTHRIYVKDVEGSSSGCNLGGGEAPQAEASYTLTSCSSVNAFPTLAIGDSFSWDVSDLPNDAVISYSGTSLNISNLRTGTYTVIFKAHTGSCHDDYFLTIIVPFQAGLKYNITCNDNGTYLVNLLDYSTFLPAYNYTHVYFTVDGGANWLTYNSIVDGIKQRQFTLNANNNYQIGIKIGNNLGHYCQKIISLDLPSVPIATFEVDTTLCQNQAVQFTPTQAYDSNLSYHWYFGDGTQNLQYAPSRAYSAFGLKTVTLEVTNQYGCSSSTSQVISIDPESMEGKLEAINEACIGGDITINYVPDGGSQPVSEFTWYHNNTSTVFATTTAPSLTVNQEGAYFAHVQNAYGCVNFASVKPVGVGFIPEPQAPDLTGPTSACLNSQVTFTVPETNALFYTWVLNGIAHPEWDGENQVSFIANTSGTQSIEVSAQTTGDAVCQGESTTFEFLVLEELITPIINITNVNCESYEVNLEVSNPQENVNYYWSNGGTGLTTNITHDGPIQVRAEIQGCSVTSQIDLPIDLTSLSWSFPRGCYEYCEKELPKTAHIIGPLGSFDPWSWYENGNDVLTGNGQIADFYDISVDNTYQLMLDNKYCKIVFENMEINSNQDCKSCKIRTHVEAVKCTKINGEEIYMIEGSFNNELGTTAYMELTIPSGEGYFVQNNFTLAEGNNNFMFYFFPSASFSPHSTIQINMNARFKEENCFSSLSLFVPKCTELRTNKTKVAVLVLKPNPAIHKVQVWYEVDTAEDLSLELTDLLGNRLISKNLKYNKDAVWLNISNLARGVYNIRLIQNGNTIKYTKLIKK